jgi:SSS family solute:Na+ symporter
MTVNFIVVIIYFALLIGLAHYFLHSKVKTISDFAMAGRSWALVTMMLALVPHGSGHTMNLWESSAELGAAVYWWPIIVGGAFLPILMLWTGPWLREMNVETVAQAMGKIYGKHMHSVHAVVMPGCWVAISMAEVLAIGGAIYGLTGGQIDYNPWCILIAFVLIVAYIIFGGLLELVWISAINVFVMTVGGFLALFFLGGWLAANANGWEGVLLAYQKVDQAWKFDMFNFSPAVIFKVVIPVAVLHICAVGVMQGPYMPLLAARTDEDCRKGFWICGLINLVTAFPWVIIAMVGLAPGMPFGTDPKLIVMEVGTKALPGWVFALLMVSLLTSVLSTGSAFILGNANVIVTDIIKRTLFPKMSDETRLKITRPVIFIYAVAASIPAMFAPVLFPVFLWTFSFGIPLFIIMVYGLVWKVSKPAAWITIIATYIVNFWWTFWTPSWAEGPWALNMYPVTICSFVLGTVLFAILPGEKGKLHQLRLKRVAAVASAS